MKFTPIVLSALITAPLLTGCAQSVDTQSVGTRQVLTLTPGLTTRGQSPASWRLDLSGQSEEATQTAVRAMSSRLYGSAETQLHAPLVIATNSPTAGIFGFHVEAASAGGATLEVRLDDRKWTKVWRAAAATHKPDTTYYLPLPAGAHRLQLEVTDARGVVVVDRYYWADTAAQLRGKTEKITMQTATLQIPARAEGYSGIWYMNQPQNDKYKYKYSGGFATYPQQHIPMAVYSKESNKTFFCYGGIKPDANEIVNMVGVYDHATQRVARPTAVIVRATNDTHYNPTLSLDDQGYITIFCNSHGQGMERKPGSDEASESYIYRSDKPYSIEKFSRVYTSNFSYSQPWNVRGRGLLWLHTRYDGGKRRLFWATSADGTTWSAPRQLSQMALGNYQISWAQGDRVATAFDYHPDQGGLNARTNIYYLETRDFGESWQTSGGEKVRTPLNDIQNKALVHDYEKEGLLVYLKDLNFDAKGHPVILFLTSKGFAPGPQNGPHLWRTARWTGAKWEIRDAFLSDHNYDHGSLHIEADGPWRVIAPTLPGPQPDSTGGEISVHLSRDQGKTWEQTEKWPIDNGRNQTYVRRPLNASPDFYAYWADGDALKPSASDLYFATKDGQVFRLPAKMEAETAAPVRVAQKK